MKYSDSTKLKILAHDKVSRSANPAIVRNSTVFFKNMQELLKHEKLVKKGLLEPFFGIWGPTIIFLIIGGIIIVSMQKEKF